MYSTQYKTLFGIITNVTGERYVELSHLNRVHIYATCRKNKTITVFFRDLAFIRIEKSINSTERVLNQFCYSTAIFSETNCWPFTETVLICTAKPVRHYFTTRNLKQSPKQVHYSLTFSIVGITI